MKYYPLILLLCFTYSGYGQLFQQNFQSSTTLASYINAAPSNGQFTQIAATGAGASVSVAANQLDLTRTSANGAVFGRSVGFSPAPTTLMVRFDMNVSGNSVNNTTVGEFYLGTNTATVNSFQDNANAPSNANTYAKIGIGWTTTAGQWFMRDITNTTTGANQTGTKTVLWVVNNSGASVNYRAPDGTNESIANDVADVWVATSKIFNDVAVQTGTVTGIDKFKLIFSGANGTMSFDNMLLDPIPPTPTSNAPSGQTTTSFTANWTTTSGVTGYRIDVATDAAFTMMVAGYNNLYVSGQASSSLNIVGLSSNTTYFYRVRSAAQYTVDEFASGNSSTQSTSTLLLPVKLQEFAAIRENGKTKLVWSTATELNSKSFEVERSTNDKDFTTIGTVQATGNSFGSKYNFIDNSILNGLQFYRLKMIDLDGAFDYSPIVSVVVQSTFALNLYPNPSSHTITLQYPMVGKNMLLRLVNMEGKQLKLFTLGENTTQITIPISQLPAGIYILEFDDSIQKSLARFIKN